MKGLSGDTKEVKSVVRTLDVAPPLILYSVHLCSFVIVQVLSGDALEVSGAMTLDESQLTMYSVVSGSLTQLRC